MIYKHCSGIQLLRYVASVFQLTDLALNSNGIFYNNLLLAAQSRDFQRVCWELLLMYVSVSYLWEDPSLVLKQF